MNPCYPQEYCLETVKQGCVPYVNSILDIKTFYFSFLCMLHSNIPHISCIDLYSPSVTEDSILCG
jgi:hypothetical protein